jgi:hypothetical protein
MVMKDISAIDKLERAVREDPTVLPDVGDRLEAQLESDDKDERMDAGRALRAAAEHDPELVVPYEETLVGFLSTENDSLRLSGAIGVAEIAAIAPDRTRKAVPQLIHVLEGTVAPSIEEAVIRALTRVGMETPEAVAAVDPILAERLPDATLPTQTVITKSFLDVVLEDPQLFEETTAAYVTLLEADSETVARFAAEAIAAVAETEPTAVTTPDRVLERIEELEAKYETDPRPSVGAEIETAAKTLRNAL